MYPIAPFSFIRFVSFTCGGLPSKKEFGCKRQRERVLSAFGLEALQERRLIISGQDRYAGKYEKSPPRPIVADRDLPRYRGNSPKNDHPRPRNSACAMPLRRSHLGCTLLFLRNAP